MNFYELLNEELNTSENNDICLITQENLRDNYITLKCGHKFNYLPLYNEVVKQKTSPFSLETIKVKVNEIKCPYCRTITPNIMPFIDMPGVKLIKGVNYPKKYCLMIHKCEWVYKFGKCKGSCCNKPAIQTEYGILCKLHLNKYSSKNLNLENSKNYNFDIKNYKNYTVKELKNILKDMNLKISGTKSELIERLLQKNYNFTK